MPYSASDVSTLPSNVQSLSPKRRRQWIAVYNSAYSRAKDAGKSDKEAESSAFAQANGVITGGQADHSTRGTAAFDLVPEPIYDDGEFVYRGGRVFRPGEYPDKAYSMTPAEIIAAAEAFSGPVAIDLEHVPTVLDGKLGQLVTVDAADDGSELRGIVALPKWLDQAIGSAERKVSATWNRATKQLEGLALTLNPRVPDAALMAAFAQAQTAPAAPTTSVDGVVVNVEQLRTLAAFAVDRHDTPEGQSTLQMIHDMTSRSGAICPEPGSAQMASRHEADALQAVHDMTTGHGAQCSASGNYAAAKPMFSDRKKEGLMSGIRERVRALFDKIPEEDLRGLIPDADQPGNTAKPPPAGAPAATTATADSPATMATRPAESDNERSLREQLAAEQAANRRIRAERIQEQAVAFADHYVRSTHQAFPVQRDSIIQAYVQMATIDLLLPGSATFADGKPATNVAILKAVLDSAPANQLTAEQLAPGIFAALANKDQTTTDASFATADKPLSGDQVRDLIRRTTLGQSVLDHADRGGVATTNGTSH